MMIDGKCSVNGSIMKEQDEDDDNHPTNCNPENLVFDKTLMSSTLIEEFELVCEKSGLRTIVNITYMIGFLVGCYLFGWISDSFGRIKALYGQNIDKFLLHMEACHLFIEHLSFSVINSMNKTY